ncbi:MAG: hypothetical protein HIU87_09315 [Acidobacteria bacterium]|nr:hypothetical protein [Acidobacteriota bacterium]
MIQRTAAKTKAGDEGHPGLTCLESKTVESGGANGPEGSRELVSAGLAMMKE